jgi:nicotinamide mononucleotide transporter
MTNSIINKFGKCLGVEGTFASWFVLIGIITQLLTCYIMEDTLLALCSGIAGVISVVLCSQKKYAFYFWGLLQLITILIISFQTGLFGKVIENAFYLVTTIIGMFVWGKNIDGDKVESQKMSGGDWMVLLSMLPLLILGISVFVVKFNNSEQIFLDTLTTTIGIIAQIMLIFRFKEQWVLWLILDVLCIALWAKDGNWCLMVQYIFWTINCVYGYFCWKYVK